jgi:hypothetical protein
MVKGLDEDLEPDPAEPLCAEGRARVAPGRAHQAGFISEGLGTVTMTRIADGSGRRPVGLAPASRRGSLIPHQLKIVERTHRDRPMSVDRLWRHSRTPAQQAKMTERTQNAG